MKIMEAFIKWLEYNPPVALDADGWVNFRREFKKNAPIRFFIVEKFIPFLKYPLICKYENFHNWFRYRLHPRHKYHIIDTKLKPGYYDAGMVMLHGCFSILVDFVEIEKGNMQQGWIDGVPYKNRKYRSREHGIAYLDWEISLKNPGHPSHSYEQAKNAEKIKELYLWWVDIRPNREDPYSSRDYEIPEEEEHGFLWSMSSEFEKKYPEEHKKMVKSFENSRKLEEKYEMEDQIKLMELIKIRNGLWT